MQNEPRIIYCHLLSPPGKLTVIVASELVSIAEVWLTWTDVGKEMSIDQSGWVTRGFVPTGVSVEFKICTFPTVPVSTDSWSRLSCPSRTNQSATVSSSIPAASSPSWQRREKLAWRVPSTTRATSTVTCCWCEPVRVWKAWAARQRFVLLCQ